MKVTRQIVADKIVDHLHGKVTQPEIVDWAEHAMMDADFEEADTELLSDIVGRLGLADVAEFALRREDLDEFLARLGRTQLPITKLNILHLSDLHMSRKSLPYLRKVIAGLLQDVETVGERFDAKPNLIFLTGDLINKGENADVEFKLASGEFIEPLLGKLKLSQDQLFAVPGNHEIDRNKVWEEIEIGLDSKLKDAAALTQYYKTSRSNPSGFTSLQEKLAGFVKFTEAYANQFRVYRSFFYDVYVVPYSKIKIGIVGFNSAWRCSQIGHDDGRLLIGTDLVDEAVSYLKGCDIKFCLLHHPFEMFAEWNRKQLRRKIAREFQFLFTGHIHDSEVEYLHQIFGSVFVSTSGSLNSGDRFNFYSIVQVDLAKGVVTSFLRKWYDERGSFDQETEKAADGKVSFSGFRTTNEETRQLIEVSEIRNRLQESSAEVQLVNPLEGIAELKLRDVFVDPVIKDSPSFEREDEDAALYAIDELLSSPDNLVLFGQPEFGKSMLLEYAERFILTKDRTFEGRVPARIKFSEIPKNNVAGLSHVIRHSLGSEVTREQIERYLSDGRVILLIDDFNDRNLDGHEARCSIMREFYVRYPKCRYILTLTEFLSQAFHYEALRWGEGFAAKTYFIASFNTAKIRQLLMKVSSTQSFDVNLMLNQIVFYFEQLQIPVTPLAVTLFFGVLFRDRTKKNIQNEAYLVENYLETILEKLNPADRRSELDFRDKESFLAHIAFRMVEKRTFEWTRNDFEREKLDYFDDLDEDVPDSPVFDDFFKKGILQETNGIVSFKFKFWFHFFLAKAMEKDDSKKVLLLQQRDYLRFSTALAYKAGLSRNDSQLLEDIRQRSVNALKTVIAEGALKAFEDLPVDKALVQFSDNVEKEIVERNKPEVIDKRRDALLPTSEAPQKIDSAEECDDLSLLVTLHSDIIRNTREIPTDEKVKNLRNNVNSYIALMWGSLVAFREFVTTIPEDEILKLLFKGVPSKKQEIRLKKMVEGSQRLVYQIVPLSVICYMTDHLGNPKLSRSVSRILDQEIDDVERLFHLLLLFRLNPDAAFERVQTFIGKSTSAVSDYIIYTYLRIYAYENEMTEKQLNVLIDIMDNVREKYQQKVDKEKVPAFLKDTFRPDMRKRVALKHK